MLQLIDDVALFAPERDMILLLLGETGTGKELFAQAVHRFSGQHEKGPFVAQNCAGMNDSLIESEVFGHEKGAFTGASGKRAGALGQIVAGGTVFLDEIGDLSPRGQAMLLRVLEDRQLKGVGSDKPQHIEGGIVCATNADIAGMVRDGSFRLDLRQRLQPLVIPPFRKRAEPHRHAVISHIFETLVKTKGADSVAVQPEAMRFLLDHPTPGNVREIRDGARKALLYAMRDRQGEQPTVTLGTMQRAMFDNASAHAPQDASEVFVRPGLRVLAPANSDHVTIVLTPSLIENPEILRLVHVAVAAGVMRHADSQSDGARMLGCTRGTLRSLLKEAGLLTDKE